MIEAGKKLKFSVFSEGFRFGCYRRYFMTRSPGFRGVRVGLCTSEFDNSQPVISVQPHLVSIELSVEPSTQLGVSVAVETQDCEVPKCMVRRILIDVMNLHRLTSLATYATDSVRVEKYLCSGGFRKGRSRLLLSHIFSFLTRQTGKYP